MKENEDCAQTKIIVIVSQVFVVEVWFGAHFREDWGISGAWRNEDSGYIPSPRKMNQNKKKKRGKGYGSRGRNPNVLAYSWSLFLSVSFELSEIWSCLKYFLQIEMAGYREERG